MVCLEYRFYLKHLEERSLPGVTTGGAGGHNDVSGSNGSHTGGGGHAVLLNDRTDFTEVTVGEDETDVSDNLGQKLEIER